jgi:hypothetical protein
MAYVIAALLVLLLVGAGVTFLVLQATRRRGDRTVADRDHGEGATPGGENDAPAPTPDSERLANRPS